MARYPSGITPLPGADVDDARARAVQMTLEMDAHPIAPTAPCLNPECGGPVDYLGSGLAPFYCSRTCRSRTSTLRVLATEQLELVELTLAETKHRTGIPRDALHERAQMLRWWLVRLAPVEER